MCESDCDCEEDSEDSSDSDDEPEPPSSGKDFCRPPPPPKRPDKGDRPWIGLHQQQKPDPFWKQKRCAEILREYDNFAIGPAIPCMMFTETNYDHQFPPLERRVDPVLNIATKPTISPTEIGPEARPKPLSQAEEVLNWQTENAKAHNSILKCIDAKIERLATHADQSNDRLQHLSDKMQKYYKQLSQEISRLEKQWKETTFGPASDAKEREIRRLKAQIHDLDEIIAQKKRHLCSFPDPYSFLTTPKLFTPSPFYGPSSKPQMTTSWTLPTATAHRARKKPEEKREETAATSPPKTDKGKEVFQDSQDPYSQFTIEPFRALQEDISSENNTSEEDQTDSENNTNEYSSSSSSTSQDPAEISRILMANTSSSTRQEPIYESPDEETESSFNRREPAKPTSGPWFSLDDAPPHKWRDRLIEFGAWLDTQLVKQTDIYKVIEEFCCRMTGTLKEWYSGLGPVKQDQFHRLDNSSAVLGTLHEEFIGDGSAYLRQIRQEYFERKCCSLKIKDLERHYQTMLKSFYHLNGGNDPSLKNTYVASLPDELQPELHKMAMASQKDFTQISMGHIHQMTLAAIDKLCQQYKTFSNVLNQKGKFGKACNKPYLKIKCKEKCSCHHKKKPKDPTGVQPKKKKKSF